MRDKKIVVIGGITGGIGSEIAKRLIKKNWHVVGFSKSEEKVNGFLKENDGIDVEQVDATDSDQVTKYFEGLSEKYDRIDGYIHALGTFLIKPVHLIKNDEWKATIDNNLTSAFYCMRSVLPKMNKQNSGAMVFFSSVASICGLPNHEAIGLLKVGLMG